MMRYAWQPTQTVMTAHSEADRAGSEKIRKSTTGGCVNIGAHCIKGWSGTQSLLVLSLGESELHAALKASAETFGLLVMLKDLGWRFHGEAWGDVNAAVGFINGAGFGKTRHIDTGLLWIQQVAADKRLRFGKVFGSDNLADLFANHLG